MKRNTECFMNPALAACTHPRGDINPRPVPISRETYDNKTYLSPEYAWNPKTALLIAVYVQISELIPGYYLMKNLN